MGKPGADPVKDRTVLGVRLPLDRAHRAGLLGTTALVEQRQREAPLSISLRMAGARSDVTQEDRFAGRMSLRIRALVIIPRSPTRTTRVRPNRGRILATSGATVVGSPVLPSKTFTAIGQPSLLHSRPITIYSFPLFLSRL